MFRVNFATGYVLPPYWANHPQVVKKIEASATKTGAIGIPYAMPLRLKFEIEKEFYQLPIEPIVTITGRNIITRRNVAKQNANRQTRGSIVETWATDDYEIVIAGVLISDDEHELPENDIRRLRTYCESRQPLDVESKIFTIFKITKIIIDEFSFPHTKGMQNQIFSLKCFSYEKPELIIKESL